VCDDVTRPVNVPMVGLTCVPSEPCPSHPPRGCHSYTLELNLSTFGTPAWVKLGYVGHKDSSS